MSFFKRKEKNLIPPVEPVERAPSPSRSLASSTTYVASSNGGNYGGGSYKSGGGVPDTDRSELFAGYNPESAGPNRFTASGQGPELREPVVGEETEEDVEGIKQQIRTTKQESVNSTRNALRLAREAEETARGTINQLAGQSEKLANTERHLDLSKNHALRAEDHTDEIKKLNRSIFRPAITFNKDAKRAAQEQKIQNRYEEARQERERALMDVRDTQNTLGNATTHGSGGYGDDGGRRQLTGAQQSARKAQRSRFQFDATQSDDEIEDELDDNLNEIGDVAKRLKGLGMAMGQELDAQNQRIDRISDKAAHLDTKLYSNTEKLKKI